jgi:ubiquinone/menaquinone biosynthesis C-methylase UbiE
MHIHNPILKQREANYREALTKRLSNLESCFVLDAGTGAGSMTKVLTEHLGVHVVSADVNRHVFPSVRGRVDKKKVDFVACDFASLPFRDESLCCIICDLVISTSENWRPLPVYTEFKRTLRNRGILDITDYYPESTSQNVEEKLATETWKFYREVSKALGAGLRRNFPPEKTVEELKKAGLRNVRKERIIANESSQWKKRVFAEYYRNMKRAISGSCNPKLKARFFNKLETLRKNIVCDGEIHWAWGVNYLIEAQK